jgi:tetratricopeptide (TPR) repeat protein
VLCVLALAAVALLAWQRLTLSTAERLLADARREWTSNAIGADQSLERAIEAAGGSWPAAHVLRCRLRVELDRPADALAYAEVFADELAKAPDELLEVADEAQRRKQAAVAARMATLVPSASPRRATALRIMVAAELELGRFPAALEYAQEWSKIETANPEPRLEMARALRRQSRLIPAIEACREAVRLARSTQAASEAGASDSPATKVLHGVPPKSPAESPAESQTESLVADTLRELVELLVTARDAAGARASFDELAALATDRDELALAEAYLLRLEGRWVEALARVEVACQRQSDIVEPSFLRGVILADAGKFDDAATQLAEVVRRDPYHKESHYKLAQALQRLGKSDEAAGHLAKSARLTTLVAEHLALQEQLASQPDAAKFRRLADVCQELGREREAAYWRVQAGAK